MRAARFPSLRLWTLPVAFLAVAALAGCRNPETAPAGDPAAEALTPGVMLTWQGAGPSAGRVYAYGDWRFELQPVIDDGVRLIGFTATAPGKKPLTFEPGVSGSPLVLGVGEFDPKHPGLEVAVIGYSGGAHCCAEATVLELADDGWRTVDVGRADGGVDTALPRDADGDGVLDFVLDDMAFYYAFASHADSFAPPRIYNLHGGRVVDVSREARFRPLFDATMQQTRQVCADGGAGACAAYAAAAARAGRFDEARRFVLDHARWNGGGFKRDCDPQDGDRSCPGGGKITFGTYAEALGWFLAEEGYIKASPRPAQRR